ncbi:unnamed protein product [Leptidea sinapis]|uniref:Uncharacterized protein n=1 Tax=Leptidea sinapis TaxID=189913 RepID=A0A5E4QUF1_9NEOP|nr:unnamed protein product [Leptidea sinapis]
MSLYDDLDTIKARTTEKVAGWSSGIKLLQSQLQLKKAAVTQPKREATRRSNQVLTPVIDLKSKLSKPDEDESNSNSPQHQAKTLMASLNVRDFDWNVANEYDPMWPNDYEKVAKGKKGGQQFGICSSVAISWLTITDLKCKPNDYN